MNKKHSIERYRAVDLALFALILAVCEAVTVRAAVSARFIGQAYTVSLAAAVTGIVYMRWGWRGGLHALLAGAVLCLCQHAEPRQYAVYMLGNLLSLAAVPLIKRIGSDKITEGRYLFIPVSLSVLLLMQTGRAIVALVLGAKPGELLMFYTTDCMSAVFTLLITWIAKKQNGLYEDQLHYLRRIHDEETEQEGNR